MNITINQDGTEQVTEGLDVRIIDLPEGGYPVTNFIISPQQNSATTINGEEVDVQGKDRPQGGSSSTGCGTILTISLIGGIMLMTVLFCGFSIIWTM